MKEFWHALWVVVLLSGGSASSANLGDVRRVASAASSASVVEDCSQYGLVQVFDGARWGFVAFGALCIAAAASGHTNERAALVSILRQHLCTDGFQDIQTTPETGESSC